MDAADVQKTYGYLPSKTSASTLPNMLRTEWDGDLPPSVTPWAGDDGKVERYAISLRYGHHPKGAAPVLAAIKAKYPGKEIGGEQWVAVAENPKVQVKHEKGMKAYSIQVGERKK